jgi:hypothetical protein
MFWDTTCSVGVYLPRSFGMECVPFSCRLRGQAARGHDKETQHQQVSNVEQHGPKLGPRFVRGVDVPRIVRESGNQVGETAGGEENVNVPSARRMGLRTFCSGTMRGGGHSSRRPVGVSASAVTVFKW